MGEHAILAEYLDRYRTTFEMKCEGLTPEQLARRSVPPSTMSLLGLVRHLARVEHHWFRRVLEGQIGAAPALPDRGGPRTSTSTRAAGPTRRASRTRGSRGAARSPTRARCYDRYATSTSRSTYHGEPTEVRDIIVHMIEEYARHVGHADLLRECIDGRTGQ